MSLFPECEGPIRTWAKAKPSIAALTRGGRDVYFAAPDLHDKPDQWLTIRRIGGAPTPGHTPMDNPLVSFECWGRTRLLANQLAEAVVNALHGIEAPVAMGTTIVCHGATVTLWLFQPDPTIADFPRVLVDASMVLRAA